VICGDGRTITFLDDAAELEQELYSGQIRTDQDLKRRALQLRASLQVEDGKQKVWKRGGILVGEVSETTTRSERRRRVYLTPGAFLLADLMDGEMAEIGFGRVSAVVLGNRFTRGAAESAIRMAGGRIDADFLAGVMRGVAGRTASVSPDHVLLRSAEVERDPAKALHKALEEDCRERGWRLCAQQ